MKGSRGKETTKLQLTNSRSEISLRKKYVIKDKGVKRSMRNDTEAMITDAERAAINGHMKTVYEITKGVLNNERKCMPTAIKDKEDKILSS